MHLNAEVVVDGKGAGDAATHGELHYIGFLQFGYDHLQSELPRTYLLRAKNERESSLRK